VARCENGHLDLVEKLNGAAARITALQKEEAKACASLTAELASLGENASTHEGKSLRVVLEAASAVQQRHEKRAESRKAAAEQIRRLQAGEARKQTALQKAQDAWTLWQSQWTSALEPLAFTTDTTPEIVSDQLDVIDEMRGVANDINQLKLDRIAKIERDMEGFARSVTDWLMLSRRNSPVSSPRTPFSNWKSALRTRSTSGISKQRRTRPLLHSAKGLRNARRLKKQRNRQ